MTRYFLHVSLLGNSTLTEVDFFDSAFTFTNESIEVGCCSPNTTLTKVTCGQGTSCTGECSAIGASLCPSGTCTEDPEDCSPSLLLDQQATREDSTGKQRAAATKPSWQFRWCAPGILFVELIRYELMKGVVVCLKLTVFQDVGFNDTLHVVSIRDVAQKDGKPAIH